VPQLSDDEAAHSAPPSIRRQRWQRGRGVAGSSSPHAKVPGNSPALSPADSTHSCVVPQPAAVSWAHKQPLPVPCGSVDVLSTGCEANLQLTIDVRFSAGRTAVLESPLLTPVCRAREWTWQQRHTNTRKFVCAARTMALHTQQYQAVRQNITSLLVGTHKYVQRAS
jgi:hypothetical protein